jgi:hypothetical protein
VRFFLIRARRILVNGTILLFAENGLKGAAASRAIQGFFLWPTGVSAVEVTKFHAMSLCATNVLLLLILLSIFATIMSPDLDHKGFRIL